MNHRLFLILLPCLASIGLAQVPAPTRAPLPPLQVIEGIQIEQGGRTITYQRVVPPVLPPKPAATPAPVLEPGRGLQLTAEQQRRAGKKAETLFVTATVRDHRVTELRWSQQGREYRAWSNVDFNHFAGMSELEMVDHFYQILFAVSNLTTAEAETFNRAATGRGLPDSVLKPLPPAVAWSPERGEYQLVPETAVVPAEVTAFLDTLHIYYDANRQTLAAQSAQRTAEQAAREQWLKDHPPKPKDTVISFWPADARQLQEQQDRQNAP